MTPAGRPAPSARLSARYRPSTSRDHHWQAAPGCSGPPCSGRHAGPAPGSPANGRSTFHFTGASPTEALQQARQAAAGLDVRIGGGPATIRAFLAADLIDYLHIVVVPIVLGHGERLWDGLGALDERFRIEAVTSPSGVTH